MSGDAVEILLADDNEDDLVMMKEAIVEANLISILHTAQDGEQVLEYLRQEGDHQDARRPGIVLLNMDMPRMNGFEVLAAMKTDDTLRHIPVVMLTTSNRELDIVRAYAEGVCAYVTKPSDYDQLKEMLRHLAVFFGQTARIPATE